MSVFNVILAAAIGYALGSFPTAYLLGRRLQGIDIREHGSGNMGAANTSIVFGVPYGLVVATIDAFKGLLSVLVIRWLFPDVTTLAYLAGTTAVIGHCYPVYAGFRGGKGSATIVGFGLAISVPLGLAMIAAVLVIGFITNYVALGSIAMFFFFGIMTFVRGEPTAAVVLAFIAAVLCTYRHWINIERILSGEEIPDRTALMDWIRERKTQKP